MSNLNFSHAAICSAVHVSFACLLPATERTAERNANALKSAAMRNEGCEPLILLQRDDLIVLILPTLQTMVEAGKIQYNVRSIYIVSWLQEYLLVTRGAFSR